MRGIVNQSIMTDLEEWFHVSFDKERIYWDVRPPSKEAWDDKLEWEDVIRVCFKPGSVFQPDEFYIFSHERPESYVVPLEADGGLELWNEIVERGLFSASLAIKVMSKTTGLYCWPNKEGE